MNWAQFKDHVSHMCPADAVVACWSLTQEMACLSPFAVMTKILSLNSLNSVKHLGKTPIFWLFTFGIVNFHHEMELK